MNFRLGNRALYYYLTVYSQVMSQKMSKVVRRLDVYYKRKKAYYYLDLSMVSDGEKKGSRKQTNCVGSLQTKGGSLFLYTTEYKYSRAIIKMKLVTTMFLYC